MSTAMTPKVARRAMSRVSESIFRPIALTSSMNHGMMIHQTQKSRLPARPARTAENLYLASRSTLEYCQT